MKLRVIILLELFTLLTACHTNKQTDHIFQQAETWLNVHPDSAWHLLQGLCPAQMQRKDVASYALLLTQATSKCVKPLYPCDSLLNVALMYYEKPSPERAMTLLYKGRLEDEMGNAKEATRLLQEALLLTERFPDEVETRRHVLSSLGNLYFYSSNYDSAIEKYRQLYECCNTDEDKAIALDHMASYYSIKEQKDSMFLLQNKALAYAFASQDSLIIAANLHSMGLNYYDINEEDSALYYFREALKRAPNSYPKGNSYHMIGRVLSESTTMRDSASYYLHQCQTDTTFQGRNLALLDLAQLEEESGNYRAANPYLWAYIDYADSLIYSEQSTTIERMAYKNKSDLRVQREQLKAEQRQERIIGVASFLIIGLFFYFRHRLMKKKRQQQETERQLADAEKKQLAMQTIIEDNETIIALLLQEKGEEAQKREEEIKKREVLIENLRKEKTDLQTWLFSQNTLYKKVQTYRKQWVGGSKEQKVLNNTDRQKLKETVLNIYAQQVEEWHVRHPRLMEEDLLLLCLQEAGLDSQSIAICFGYGDTHPINQRKLRIKERMHPLTS